MRTEHVDERLRALRDALAAQSFGVPDPQQPQRLARRDRLMLEIASLLARLRDLDAPLLIVFGGGTGAGKSTLTNSLVGAAVTATGVLRPTTSAPTLLAAAEDYERIAADRVLPGFPRVHRDGGGSGRGGGLLHVAETEALPANIAIVDAPDVDSIRTANRDLADLLLDAADVWVWLVTPRTYADEEGMRYLRRAARRRIPLAVVVSQVAPDDRDEIVADLRAKLAAEDLDPEILVVPWAQVDDEQLPPAAVQDVRDRLEALADPETRARLRRQALDGAILDLRWETQPLLDAVMDELQVCDALVGRADSAFARVTEAVGEALDEGLPLRQEVLARWTDVVGGGRVAALVESATGMVRTWLPDAMASVTSAEQERVQRQVRADVADSVSERIVDAVTLAVAEVVDAWDRTPAGRGLLHAEPGLRAPSADLNERVTRAVAAWQESVADLVATRGAERRVRARWVSTAVNAGATAAIVLAFASTGGVTGAEAGLAAGASAANQALLIKLLGAQNLNWLLRRVREDLLERVAVLAGDERSRYRAAVSAIAPEPAVAQRLRAALSDIDERRTGAVSGGRAPRDESP